VGSGPVEDYRYVGYRRKLIEEISGHGIDDLEILQLFDRVPRHIFLPEGVLPRAYEDAPLPIGYGQTASQPSLQAYYLEILRPTDNDTVLEIGTGSGYLTALLALVAQRVYSVERVRELSIRARKALDEMKFKNVALMVGDGTIGWRKFSSSRHRRRRSPPRWSISFPREGACSCPSGPGTPRSWSWCGRRASSPPRRRWGTR
jgi:protein-L-isoaspartate(D-aspartate) O-methyltransferase